MGKKMTNLHVILKMFVAKNSGYWIINNSSLYICITAQLNVIDSNLPQTNLDYITRIKNMGRYLSLHEFSNNHTKRIWKDKDQ